MTNRWPLVGLGEALSISTERVEPREHSNVLFNYVGLEHIEGHTGRILPHEPTCGSEIASTKNVFRSGEILYGKLRPYLNKVHVADRDGICSTDIFVLRCEKRRALPAFAAYFLRAPLVLNRISDLTQGANLPRLSASALLGISIPLPPLPEQERVVQLLDAAEELRRLRAQADHRTADLIPALFYDMFGDPNDLRSMQWPLRRVDSFSAVNYGLADKLDASTTETEGVRIITISNVRLDGSMNLAVEKYSLALEQDRQKAQVRSHDLLFNWRNGSEQHVGKTAIWEDQLEGEILHVSFLLKIRVDSKSADPYYIWVLLNMMRAAGFFTRNARMQINTKFNASELSALQLPIPPHPLQRQFAARVQEIRALEARQAESRRRLDDLFQSLLHRAFQGEL